MNKRRTRASEATSSRFLMSNLEHKTHDASETTAKVLRSFWVIGLLNNAPWVLMLACAPSISSGGVALVFLSNQIPGLLVKITAPYWFHKVTYKCRMLMASICMGLACLLVGFGGLLHDESVDETTHAALKENKRLGLSLELFGCAFISLQCSLGEVCMPLIIETFSLQHLSLTCAFKRHLHWHLQANLTPLFSRSLATRHHIQFCLKDSSHLIRILRIYLKTNSNKIGLI